MPSRSGSTCASTGSDRQRCRIGFDLGRAARPFVAATPGQTAQHHAELAARLRQRGLLAASEGRRVVGLSNRELARRAFGLDPAAVVAEGSAAARMYGPLGRELEQTLDLLDTVEGRGLAWLAWLQRRDGASKLVPAKLRSVLRID